ncbi:unnamed protein product, partial [Ectocarpus fasciculatus]
MLTCGVLHGMPSVMFVFNRENETKRMKNSINDFNDAVQQCANALKIDLAIVPTLQAYSTGEEAVFKAALRQFNQRGRGCTSIPVMLCMSNDAKLANVASTIQDVVNSNLVKTDAKG